VTDQPPPSPYQPDQQGAPPGPGNPQPGAWTQPPPGPGPYGMSGPVQAQRPRRKRRVFLWIFVALQVLFLILVIAGVAATKTGPSHARLVALCYDHRWWPVFSSQAQCVAHETKTLTVSGDVGEGLGVAVEVFVWFVVDAILGIGYGIYRLAIRSRRAGA
jgi:hypothetical protein